MSVEFAPAASGAPVSRWETYPDYRDSDVKWLGEIPVHWNAIKIRRLCQVKRGASPRPIDDPIYFSEEGKYYWVRISDVTASKKFLQITEQKLSELGKSKSIPLEPGEIFLSRNEAITCCSEGVGTGILISPIASVLRFNWVPSFPSPL